MPTRREFLAALRERVEADARGGTRTTMATVVAERDDDREDVGDLVTPSSPDPPPGLRTPTIVDTKMPRPAGRPVRVDRHDPARLAEQLRNRIRVQSQWIAQLLHATESLAADVDGHARRLAKLETPPEAPERSWSGWEPSTWLAVLGAVTLAGVLAVASVVIAAVVVG